MRLHRVPFVLILAVSASMLLGAAAPPSRPEQPVEDERTPRPGTLAAAMLTIRETADARRAAIEAQLSATPDLLQRQTLQAELARAKQTEELDLLRAQLEFAIAEGRLDWATTLQSAIERIVHPPDLVDPEARRISAQRGQTTSTEEAPR